MLKIIYIYIDFDKQINDKDAKFQIANHVTIFKHNIKNILQLDQMNQKEFRIATANKK